MSKETVTITKEKYDYLVESYQRLCALESSGVDNWCGYDHAKEILKDGVRRNKMKELILKIEQWAEDRNIIKGAKPLDQAMKLFAEHGEMSDHVGNNELDKVFDDVGDVFVVLTIIAKQCNTSISHRLDTKLKHSGLKVDVAFLASELATIATELHDWESGHDHFPIYALGDAVARLRSIAEQVGLTLEYCVEQAYIDIKDRKGILYEGVFIKESNPAYKEALEKLGKV